jgi:hypothetical protein
MKHPKIVLYTYLGYSENYVEKNRARFLTAAV